MVVKLRLKALNNCFGQFCLLIFSRIKAQWAHFLKNTLKWSKLGLYCVFFDQRVKKISNGRSSDMLPNFDHLGIFKTNSISNQLSSFLMKLIRIIYVLSSFENMKTVYEPHIIFKETDAKLKRWSKFGLLWYLFIIINCCTIFFVSS